MFLTLNGFKIKSSSISQKSEDITILNTCINLLQFLSFLNRFLPSLNVSIIWHSNRPKLYTSLVTQTIKNLLEMEETWVWSLGLEDCLEKVMAPHSSTLAWKVPWSEEPGRLQSMGLLRVGHDWVFTFTFHFHALEKEMATHSSVLAWRIPGTGEPGGLQSMRSHRVGHDWSNAAAAAAANIFWALPIHHFFPQPLATSDFFTVSIILLFQNAI